MNVHQKLAIGLAPFLLIGGWVVADYWDNAKKRQEQVHVLALDEPCLVSSNQCTLSFPGLTIRLQSEDRNDKRIFRVLSSSELDTVLLAAGAAEDPLPVKLAPVENKRQWRTALALSELPAGTVYPVRMAFRNHSGQYTAEFDAQ
ncbi:MAG: hypothetical protein ACWA44_12100 [Thiotrichales bacterium]